MKIKADICKCENSKGEQNLLHEAQLINLNHQSISGFLKMFLKQQACGKVCTHLATLSMVVITQSLYPYYCLNNLVDGGNENSLSRKTQLI